MPERGRKAVSYGISGLFHFLLFLTFAVALKGPVAISDQVLPFLRVGLAEIDIGVKGPPSIKERRAPGDIGRVGRPEAVVSLNGRGKGKAGENERGKSGGSTPAINPGDHEAGVTNTSGGITSKTAQNLEFTGIVRLKVLVGADGAARDVVVLEGSGRPAVDEAAVAAARRFAYRAKVSQGKAVDSWVEVSVEFKPS